MNADKRDWRRLYPFKSRFLDVDGVRMHYVDEGSGPVILMLHGNPTWSFYYRQLIKALRRGEHLGMLVDQKLNEGIPVPFFGRDAMTAPALAQLARRFACPVAPVRVERLEGAHFRLTVYPPLTLAESGDREADTAAAMGQVNAIIEGWIRDRPEQWLWLHRRWPE